MEGIHIALSAEKIGELWGVPITNTLIMSWLVSAFLIAFAVIVGRRLQMTPGRLQTVIESGVEGGVSYIEGVLEDKQLGRIFFPLIGTFFIFILIANWSEFIPGVGSIGFFEEHDGHTVFAPLFRSIHTELNMTLALTIIAFLTIELTGIRKLGFLKYASKFVNFKTGFVGFLVGIVELIGNLARLISLSFRLFGNILAGEVLLVVIAAFVPLFAPVPFIGFELFIGFLQAAIFALLTLAFIRIAIEKPHGDEH
jgi:F-type H+-transporting ATPase subunit a